MARRAFLRTASMVAAAAIFAACTSGGPDDGSDAAGGQPSPTTAATPDESAAPSSPSDSTGTAAGTTQGTTQGTATGTSQPSEPPATQDPRRPRSFTVVMNGDMLLHEGLWATAQIDARRTGHGGMDFRPLLASMRPTVAGADLAICHMETPLAPVGGPFSGYPVFAAPPAIVPALKWAGYDACTTASNHSIDQGFEGLARTIHDFDRAGIEHTGTAVRRSTSRRPLMLDANGVSVALISATYGTNGIPLPEGRPWSVNLLQPRRILRLAAEARAEGADVVMVALHWGLEYYHPPTSDQLAVVDQLTRSPDIDFIYGHHAHVVQPYDRVHGTWVVYGLGNAVAQQDTSVEGVYDGNTARVTFRERRDGSFGVSKLEYIPTMITHFDGVHPMRWLNVPRSLRNPALAGLRAELKATAERVRSVVGMEGAFRRGVEQGR